MKSSFQNIPVETALLATIITYPDQIFQTILAEEAFTGQEHRNLWKFLAALGAQGKTFDHSLLAIDGQGLAPFIDKLMTQPVDGTQNLPALIEELRKLHELRKITAQAKKIIKVAHESQDPNQAITEAARLLETQGVTEIEQVSDVLQATLEAGPTHFLPVYLVALAKKLNGGFRLPSLTMLGARPSVGKTALALNLAINIAKEGFPCLLIEIEQAKEEDAERFAAIVGQLPLRSVQRREGDLKQIVDEHQELPLYLLDTAATIEDVVAITHKATFLGVKAVFIDYLQLLGTAEKYHSSVQQVTAISRQLKLLSKATGTAIIALSQLSRESEKRKDKHPQLSDLRESGALEQDADAAMLLYRDEEMPTVLEIDLAKNRHGPKGKANAYYDLETQEIFDVELW